MRRVVCLVLLITMGLLLVPAAFAEEKAGWSENEIVPPMTGRKIWGREMSFIDPEKIAGYSEEAKAVWREIEALKTKRRLDAYLVIASAAAIAIAAFGGALAQGMVASKAMEGIARNPEATGKLFTPLIISLALIETLVIYALAISIMLQLKM